VYTQLTKCHGLMIVGEYYQEYISWSIDIVMRIQNLCEGWIFKVYKS